MKSTPKFYEVDSSRTSDFAEQEDHDMKLATLLSHGFEQPDIEVALRKSNNDVTKAYNILSSAFQPIKHFIPASNDDPVNDDHEAGPSSEVFPVFSFKSVRRTINTEECGIFSISLAVMRCVEVSKELLNNNIFDPLCNEFLDMYLPKCITLHVSPPEDIIALLNALDSFHEFLDSDKMDVVLKEITEESLLIIDEVDEKQVRDSLCRNHVVEATDICMKWIDLLGESAEACNRTRLKFFLRCITCNQLDAKVFAFHELGRLAGKLRSSSNLVYVSAFNSWLKDNNIIKHALQGNMDQPTYLEKIRPILSYMTSEMSASDLGRGDRLNSCNTPRAPGIELKHRFASEEHQTEFKRVQESRPMGRYEMFAAFTHSGNSKLL
ncbi:unnamed protein product [Heligmosomoides polygyrus]|uniref:UBA domain-containing protein n=1 Tax=Heligmosomoides polygyrus TaxID=6339 RepID=A0A3P8AV88_HELPZ|nr:unnamed protein product [Heligmosomoides polygyrus]